jgi:hypothetical protein
MDIFVLTELRLGHGNEISQKVAGVTSDITEAEKHAANGPQFSFDTFQIDTDTLQAGADTTELLTEIRAVKKAVLNYIDEQMCDGERR